MNTDEADRVLAKMQATWRQELTAPEIGEWHETLRRLRYVDAIGAVEEIRESSGWLPKHNEMVRTVQDVGRRRVSAETVRALPEPVDDGSCHRCGDTGWAEVEVAGAGVSAVERCRCSKGRLMDRGLDKDYEHPRSCSCHVCTYGPVKARAARRAREGDPLGRVIEAAPPRMPYVEEDF